MNRLLVWLLGLGLAGTALAGSQVLSVTGQVQLQGPAASALKRGDTLADAIHLRSGAASQAQLMLADGSLLTLPADSEVQVSLTAQPQVQLLAGGVTVLPAKGDLTLQAMGSVLKTSGLLRLRQCAAGCPEPLGLYGKALSGEVIVEYAGGRAVLRNKTFRASSASVRPVILARDPPWLAEDSRLDLATQAKADLANELRAGMDAYKNGQFDQAWTILTAVREKSPTEKMVSYYLGLTALERKDSEAALSNLRQYQRDDPDAAAERGVNQLVTLLLTNQLQSEVKLALQQESELSQSEPEPNSVAVQAFTNKGDPAYAVLAKGLAAMVITDLSKIPGLKVLERQKVQKLVDEISLNQSGLVGQDSQVKAGRLMRAEKVLVGSFGVQP